MFTLLFIISQVARSFNLRPSLQSAQAMRSAAAARSAVEECIQQLHWGDLHRRASSRSQRGAGRAMTRRPGQTGAGKTIAR